MEAGHPSTSTPIEVSGKSRGKAVPIKLVGLTENGPSTPARKPRMHTPVRPVVHAVLDDDDPEVLILFLVQIYVVLICLCAVDLQNNL